MYTSEAYRAFVAQTGATVSEFAFRAAWEDGIRHLSGRPDPYKARASKIKAWQEDALSLLVEWFHNAANSRLGNPPEWDDLAEFVVSVGMARVWAVFAGRAHKQRTEDPTHGQ